MKTIVLTILSAFFLLAGLAIAQTDYNSSPYNYKNSPSNHENSSTNYRNSPYNYDNSPYKYNNDRIIRDNQGRAQGYAVPKDDGGTNYYDMNGKRQGYKPAEED